MHGGDLHGPGVALQLLLSFLDAGARVAARILRFLRGPAHHSSGMVAAEFVFRLQHIGELAQVRQAPLPPGHRRQPFAHTFLRVDGRKRGGHTVGGEYFAPPREDIQHGVIGPGNFAQLRRAPSQQTRRQRGEPELFQTRFRERA